jgi:hypothetical protein
VHPLERHQVDEALHTLLVRNHAEVLADRKHAAGELVEVLHRAHVE